MGCYCNENGKLDESKEFIRSIYKAFKSMRDFVNKMNEYGAGWYIEDGYVFTKYFSCPCTMLESVDIELLESIKTGSKQCLMKIIKLNKE